MTELQRKLSKYCSYDEVEERFMLHEIKGDIAAYEGGWSISFLRMPKYGPYRATIDFGAGCTYICACGDEEIALVLAYTMSKELVIRNDSFVTLKFDTDNQYWTIYGTGRDFKICQDPLVLISQYIE